MQELNTSDLSNISFPNAFFEDEVREGFFVMTMVKRYWAAQLKVLSEIDRICNEHEIKWFADYGTLIGAVRHEGYVPWDDDMDISMMRSDYERFFEAARKELPAGYKILNVQDEPEYGETIGRIVNSEVIDYSNGHLEEFCGCPYTVGIDIYPLDSVYDDEEKETERRNRALKVSSAIGYVDKGENESYECKKLLGDIERENHIILNRKDKLRWQLMKLLDKIFGECASDDSKNVAIMAFFVPHGDHLFERFFFEYRIKLKFENTLLWAPARYEEVLNTEYGDFMNVYKGGGMHDYPVYIGQEITLKEKIQRNPYRYTFNYNELLTAVGRYTKKIINGAAGNLKGAGNRGEEIVFLPCRAKWWNTMEPLWKEAIANTNNSVHVLPIFYYDCDYNGTIGERHDETALFPKYLHVGNCVKYDFKTRHPDKIVIQVPYDDWSSVMTVHEFFYSRNLLQYTDKLIYVPCLDAEPPVDADDKASVALAALVEQPAVINADKIILTSDAMKRFYVETLVRLSGEETRNYWEEKIVATGLQGDEQTDKKESDRQCEIKEAMPSLEKYNEAEDLEEWNNLIGKHLGKKIIIYFITISFLLKGKEKAIDKIMRSLKVFRENSDKVCAVMIPQKQILDDLRKLDPELWQQYKNVTDEIQNSQVTVLDEEGIALKHMDRWNAYYGDSDFVARQCVLRGIPVMIESLDV